jgi:hypothetical protein
VDWITAKAANNVKINQTELLYERNERFRKNYIRGWVDSFLTRHAEQLFEIKSVLQEKPRLEVPRVFLQAALDGLRDHIYQACAELMRNLDKIGINEWEDRCTQRVIIPSAMKAQTIFHGVHRNLKHISIVTCISAAGEHMTLFSVSSQVKPMAEGRLRSEGVRRDVDLILKH